MAQPGGKMCNVWGVVRTRRTLRCREKYHTNVGLVCERATNVPLDRHQFLGYQQQPIAVGIHILNEPKWYPVSLVRNVAQSAERMNVLCVMLVAPTAIIHNRLITMMSRVRVPPFRLFDLSQL